MIIARAIVKILLKEVGRRTSPRQSRSPKLKPVSHSERDPGLGVAFLAVVATKNKQWIAISAPSHRVHMLTGTPLAASSYAERLPVKVAVVSCIPLRASVLIHAQGRAQALVKYSV